ncbi:EAL and HDOD domain-containing protein [Marinobacterium jannaschii]|uniref:EAL and HDOD domain-containing protein n=1 Tax=Marinobacterium jannaschii TaxID=64970 RepID=UPI000482CD96|nr:HDOD domain-containing protein [Marinobacterium jannaschii]
MENALSDVLMARQPIFDRRLNVVAYELLYRSNKQNVANVFDGNKATSDVLINSFTSIFDAGDIKTLPAFLNLPESFVKDDRLPAFPKELLVLEVLEDVEVNEETIAGVKRFVDAGYRVALDDFIYSPEYDPLLDMAHIVKIDLTQTKGPTLIQHVKKLQDYNVTLLAEKVETHEEFQLCMALGFKLFQGYFLSKPTIVEGRKLSGNEMVVVQLLAALENPDISPDELQQIITRDPNLTFKLLKIVNSSLYALANEIESISQAIVTLGLSEIKKWVTLISLSGNNSKPTELTRQILQTGRMCESVARQGNVVTPSTAFMTGLLSMMGAMLDITETEIFEQIAVSEEIEQAVRHQNGPAGALLCNVRHYINGEFGLMSEDENQDIYRSAYSDALEWAEESLQMMYNT